MSDDRQPLRRYLKRRLGGAGWLRSQTFLVLAASFLVGALASHVLLRLGITDLRLRLPLIVGVWLRLTGIDAVKVRLDPGRPGEGTERIRDTQASAQGNLLDKAETVADGVSGIGELASIDAEGCLPAVGFAIVAAVIALAALVFWWIIGGFLGAASAALLEAAVEAVLTVGMVRVAGGGASSWVSGAMRASWLFWLLLATGAFGLAWLLKRLNPEAVTVFQAINSIF